MTKLVHREIILAKIETTYGVDAVPTAAADAMQVEEPNWAHEGARMIERPLVRTSKGRLRQLFGGTLQTVSFRKEVKGSGTIDAPGEIGPLLRACGKGETVVVSTSVTYKPVDTGLESVTIYYFEDGSRHILTGCVGTVAYELTAGARIMATFTFMGHAQQPTDVAFPTPTYETTVPPIFISAGVTIGGFGPVFEALSIDMGNQVITPADANASDGYGQIRIISRDVNGSFNPDATLVATKDFIGNWRDGVVEALNTGVLGNTAGNRVQFQMPAVSARSVAPGNRDGIRIYDYAFGAAESAGDDELSIIFT